MSPDRAKLLLVDDSRSSRRMISELMHELGFPRIDEAPDGLSALGLFQNIPYDVVLTDWNMPFLNGIELLRAIRKWPERSSTPVLLFTADASPKRVVEALEAGANAFVATPFEPATLRDKVEGLVASLPPVTEFMPAARTSGAVRPRG